MKTLDQFYSSFFFVLLLTSIGAIAHATPLLWMTDGSPVVFSDTQKLDPVMTPKTLLGSQAYEGSLDWTPSTGDTQLPVYRDSLVTLEAEWVLIKDDGFQSLVDENTLVTLQGMTDGKYFYEFMQDTQFWLPASIGNNVIAKGDGLLVSLGDLQQGRINASIDIRYIDANGNEKRYRSSSQSISELPLVPLINQIIQTHSDVVTHINLGAIEPESAWVNNKGVRTKATVDYLFSCVFTFRCTKQPVTEGVLRSIGKDLKQKGAYMNKQGTLTVTNENNEIIGTTEISLRD